MRIGIDIDGVIASFYDAYERAIIAVTGRNLFPIRGKETKSIHPPVWDWPEHYGYTKDEVRAAWKFIKNDPLFWRRLPVMPDARLVPVFLNNPDNDVYFITSRPGLRAKAQTEGWFKDTFGAIPTVMLSDRKGDVARGLDLEIFVDDKPENCLDVNQKSPDTLVYMPRRDYNENHVPRGTILVEGLEDVLRMNGLMTDAAELRRAA